MSVSHTLSGLLLAASLARPAAAVPIPPSHGQTTIAQRGTSQASLMPPFESIATPAERAVLTDLLAQLRHVDQQQPGSLLAPFDAALARLSSPTPLRGSIQMERAMLLGALHREQEATRAMEEAIRLLPGYSGPLLAAVGLYAFGNFPDRAADDFIRASLIDPKSALMVDDYTVNAIRNRLLNKRDHLRGVRLSKRLLDIGWTGDGVGSRSDIAQDAIATALEHGDITRARALVPELVVPAHSYKLLALEAAQPIWPDIIAWAGERLEKQWPLYLGEARARWTASNDPDRARDYATALTTAGAFDQLIADFAPVVAAMKDRTSGPSLVFIVPMLARAQMATGRTPDGLATFDNAAKTWPLGSEANALNVAANRGRYLLYAGRSADALTQLDLAIADARKWGPEVNLDAIAAMHHYRACALHELGRDQEVGPSLAIATASQSLETGVETQLCLGDVAGARNMLVTALGDPSRRDDAVYFLQPPNDALPTDYAGRLRERFEQLRHDPALLAALKPWGRILPFTLSASAPRDEH